MDYVSVTCRIVCDVNGKLTPKKVLINGILELISDDQIAFADNKLQFSGSMLITYLISSIFLLQLLINTYLEIEI